jgi:hypothetical protein
MCNPALKPLNNFEPAFQRPTAIYAAGSALNRSRSRSPTMFAPRGERLIEDVTIAVRRNPMQAVAVDASIAYPPPRWMLPFCPAPIRPFQAPLCFGDCLLSPFALPLPRCLLPFGVRCRGGFASFSNACSASRAVLSAASWRGCFFVFARDFFSVSGRARSPIS